MALKGRAEGAGCVFLGKTRRDGREERQKRRKKNTRKCQQEKRDGSTPERMPAGTGREKQDMTESFGKPKAYFFYVQLICYCYISFTCCFFSLSYSLFFASESGTVSYLFPAAGKSPQTCRQKFLNIFFCRNPYISEIIFHINCAGRTAEKYI